MIIPNLHMRGQSGQTSISLIQRDARLNLRGFDSQSETQKGVCVFFRNAGYSFCAFARPLSSARARSAVQKLSSGFTPFALDKCLILETSKSEKDLSKKHSETFDRSYLINVF